LKYRSELLVTLCAELQYIVSRYAGVY